MVFWLAISFVFLLILFIAITAIAHLFLRVPYVPTPNGVCKTIVEFAGFRGNERLVDLGAGDGRVLIAVKRAYPGITAEGYELAPTIWLLGKICILFSRQKIAWHRKSMFSADLHSADCVFVYLLPGMLLELEKKFNAELRPGTKVLSYTFAFGNRTPTRWVEVPWLLSTRKLFLYEW